MWAFLCGIVSVGAPVSDRWLFVLGGVLLAGPMVCGASQAVNDWFDRHVDAINEPGRPIPSGRIPGRWGLYIAIAWSALSLALGASLGTWTFVAAIVAVALAWAYSAPPFRLKISGLWGPAVVGLSYEGIAWFTGAAIMVGGFPGGPVVMLALLYSIGAHGIMTLNDFKAVEGDTATGVRSLPVMLGPERAARAACWVMAVPQALVGFGLLVAGRPLYGAIILFLLAAQATLMQTLLRDPKRLAPWYNATGVTLYVLGMLIAAIAIRPFTGV